jgi:hypothetical protein
MIASFLFFGHCISLSSNCKTNFRKNHLNPDLLIHWNYPDRGLVQRELA